MAIFLHEKYQKDNETIKIKSKKFFQIFTYLINGRIFTTYKTKEDHLHLQDDSFRIEKKGG
ncbi:hypothetical protein CUM88_06835 [Enterococcus faecium]|nr:hypothetical protein [Enterococcus faecium]EGP5284669.1 hypothetical protein [Enterococcus faecium]PQC05672.1 hypothetical protein CUM88_06835 [Enterococcus faecium]PQD53353.1 hypothetical protein CUM79_05960 [Enterococcus faecium]